MQSLLTSVMMSSYYVHLFHCIIKVCGVSRMMSSFCVHLYLFHYIIHSCDVNRMMSSFCVHIFNFIIQLCDVKFDDVINVRDFHLDCKAFCVHMSLSFE